MNVFKVSRVPVVRILPIHFYQVTSDKSLEKVAGSSVRLLFCLYLYWPLRDSRFLSWSPLKTTRFLLKWQILM
ncbi:hypothetical protein EMCRGX_G004040 [Ephydatia muelleri]